MRAPSRICLPFTKSYETSPCQKIHHIFHLNGSIFNQNQIKDSGPWNSICKAGKCNKEFQQMVEKGLWVLMGNGQRTLFWEDPWISNL